MLEKLVAWFKSWWSPPTKFNEVDTTPEPNPAEIADQMKNSDDGAPEWLVKAARDKD